MIPFIFSPPLPAVVERWIIYRPILERALETDLERKLTVEGTLDAIKAGAYQLHEIRMGREVVGVCVTAPGGLNAKSLFVVTAAGDRMEDWIENLVDYLDKLAESLEMTDGILFCGRPGWQKKLVALGFKTVLVTMARA